MTAADYDKARRLLIRRDPVLGSAIKRIGRCGMASRQHQHHFVALVHAIVAQQVSSRAAATIFGRLVTAFPDQILTAHAIAAAPDASLRAAGLSRQKLGYLRDLSERVVDGRLRLEELDALNDDEVVARLTAVKGFGCWTAQMFLMFRLNRPDVLPVNDLAILRAVQQLYGLRKPPDARRLLRLGESWRPYRSVACWYLWQSLRQPTAVSRQP